MPLIPRPPGRCRLRGGPRAALVTPGGGQHRVQALMRAQDRGCIAVRRSYKRRCDFSRPARGPGARPQAGRVATSRGGPGKKDRTKRAPPPPSAMTSRRRSGPLGGPQVRPQRFAAVRFAEHGGGTRSDRGLLASNPRRTPSASPGAEGQEMPRTPSGRGFSQPNEVRSSPKAVGVASRRRAAEPEWAEQSPERPVRGPAKRGGRRRWKALQSNALEAAPRNCPALLPRIRDQVSRAPAWCNFLINGALIPGHYSRRYSGHPTPS